MSHTDRRYVTPGRRDPGWRPLLRYLPVLVWPDPRAWSWWLRRRGEPLIVIVRATVASSAVFYLIVLAVLLWLDLDARRSTAPHGGGASAPVLLALDAAAVIAGQWWSRRPISCGDQDALKLAFRSRFLVGVAFVNAGVLFGFVAAFLVSALWPYLVGMGLGLVGTASVAPTNARVRRRADELARAGCAGALQEVLF